MRKTGLAGIAVLVCVASTVVAVPQGWTEEGGVLAIEVAVSPSTVALDSEGEWLTVHTDIAYSCVDRASLELNGIEIVWTKYDARGCLVAKFELDAVKDVIAPPSAELTMIGVCKDGTPFEGSDTIRVCAPSGR